MDQIDACRQQIEQSQKETMTEAELKDTWIKKHEDISNILKVKFYCIICFYINILEKRGQNS